MRKVIELVCHGAILCFVAGILLVAGGDNMIEMIWGAFTTFEGVPDFTHIGLKMVGYSLIALLVGFPLMSLGIAWGWLTPSR